MLIIYFLLGVGITTAHNDYGVSFRAQNFDNTVQNIDKEAYIKHQREKRLVTEYVVPQNVPDLDADGLLRLANSGGNSTSYFMTYITKLLNEYKAGVIPNSGYSGPQNLTNKPTWGNLNITRNHTTFTGPSNTSRNLMADEQIFFNNGTRPNNQAIVIYPSQPGYVEPLKNTIGFARITVEPYGNKTDKTQKYFNPGQNYTTNVTWPVYPTYNYINVRSGYNYNNTSNASGYNIPVNSGTPGHRPYPGYPGYPAPNTSFTTQYTGYPAQNTSYPALNTGYPAQNTGYPASKPNPGQTYNTSVTRPVYPNYNNINVIPANKNNFSNSSPSGYNVQPVNPVTPGNTPYYQVPNTGYPASNTSILVPNTGYPAPNTGYSVPHNGNPVHNSGYPASNLDYASPNTGYRAPNTGYPASNTGIPAPNTGYPIPPNGYSVPNSGYPASNLDYAAPNTGYRAPNTGYPASSGYPAPNTFYPPPSSFIPKTNVTGFVPKPNPGFTIHDAAPRNNSNGFNNSGNGFNNTASSENCKCKLPRDSNIITKEGRSMDACMIACNNCPAGMTMRFGICVDLDYDDE